MQILEIKFVKTQSESVICRADVSFDWFLLKGFKILRNKAGKEFVTPPSYLAGKFWRELFKTHDEKDWHEIQHRILDAYNEHLIKESVDEADK